MRKKQVYILCRQEGKDVAINIKESLERRHYTVFVDVDSESEMTCIQYEQIIDECMDFIPVLSKDSWIKKDENDTFIKKLEVALNSKNVIPIITRGVVFPSVNELADNIKDLANRNGLPDNAVPQCFEGIMDRLDKAFLTSHRKLDARTKYFFYSTAIVSVVSIIVLSCLAFIALRKYPSTQKEKTEVNTAITYFSFSIASYGSPDAIFFKDLESLYRTANEYMTDYSKNPNAFERDVEQFYNEHRYMKPQNKEEFLKSDKTKLLKGITEFNYKMYVELEMQIYEDIQNRISTIQKYVEQRDFVIKWPNYFTNLIKESEYAKNYKMHLMQLLLSNVNINAEDKNGKLIFQDFISNQYIPSSDIYWISSKKDLQFMCIQDKRNWEEIRKYLESK